MVEDSGRRQMVMDISDNGNMAAYKAKECTQHSIVFIS